MKTDLLFDRAPYHIRQSIGEAFADQAIDEYINGDKRSEFTYPRLQFKVLQGDPCIIAIGEDAVEAMREIVPDLEELEINGIIYKIVEKEIVDDEVAIGPSKTFINYQFITPWIGLNEENFLQFKYYYKQERTAFINRLVVQNLRFLSQEFGIQAGDRINIKSRIRFLTNQSLTSSPTGGFVGDFKINYNIPDYISIGNMIAKGFGAIKRVEV
jgi:hypothetical protein